MQSGFQHQHAFPSAAPRIAAPLGTAPSVSPHLYPRKLPPAAPALQEAPVPQTSREGLGSRRRKAVGRRPPPMPPARGGEAAPRPVRFLSFSQSMPHLAAGIHLLAGRIEADDSRKIAQEAFGLIDQARRHREVIRQRVGWRQTCGATPESRCKHPPLDGAAARRSRAACRPAWQCLLRPSHPASKVVARKHAAVASGQEGSARAQPAMVCSKPHKQQ